MSHELSAVPRIKEAVIRTRVVIVAVLALSPAFARAQSARRGGVTLSVGLSAVASSSRFVATQRVPHLEIGVDRIVRPGLSAAVAFDAYVMGTIESQPLCAVPDGGFTTPCERRTERAGSLVGMTVEARWRPRRRGLAVSAGAGAFLAPSVHGPVSGHGAALSGGAEYVFGESTGVRPLLKFRTTRLLSDVGGVRWTVSPTIGLQF